MYIILCKLIEYMDLGQEVHPREIGLERLQEKAVFEPNLQTYKRQRWKVLPAEKTAWAKALMGQSI